MANGFSHLSIMRGLVARGQKEYPHNQIFRSSANRSLAIVAVTAKMSLALSLLDELLSQRLLCRGQWHRSSPIGIDRYGLWRTAARLPTG
jgi:hypothetical protein